MQVFRRVLSAQIKQCGAKIFSKRQCSGSVVSITELEGKGNYLFSQEQERQLAEVGRVEKITVEVSGPPEDVVLVMNQNISTPYDCCKHISLQLCQRTPLALLNDKILWHMHRPLPGNCKMKFLTFRDKNPFSLNEAFWRTGSFVLGAVIKRAFKEDAGVLLHSFPYPIVNSGSFIYDVEMKIKDWRPSVDELKILSGEFITFVQGNHKIERLSVKKSLALEIFEGNPHKQKQLSGAADNSEDGLVTLYRVGDHIDLVSGPMVGDTSFFGRCSVASVHQIPSEVGLQMYRFQGVALPKGIMLNSYAYSALLRRAEILNKAEVPDVSEFNQPFITKYTKERIDPDPMNVV